MSKSSLSGVELQVRRAAARFALSGNERLMLDVLLVESFGIGREQIPLNGMEDLVKRLSWFTGLRTDHCGIAARGLFRARILVRDDPCTFVMIDPEPGRWRLRERERAEVAPFQIGVDGELFPGPSVAAEIAKLSINQSSPDGTLCSRNPGDDQRAGPCAPEIREVLAARATEKREMIDGERPVCASKPTVPELVKALRNAAETPDGTLCSRKTGGADRTGQCAPEIREAPEKREYNVKTLTFNRSNVSTDKRSTLAREAAPEIREVLPGRAAEGLEERIRKFVGDRDFAAHWRGANYLWQNPERRECAERSLRYLAAGIESGEVIVRTTNGRALWSQVQRDWVRAQRERAREISVG
jgi:hypothetical protein